MRRHLVRVLLVGSLAPVFSTWGAGAASIGFEQRVEAQRAIEAVYWDRRIWPAANSTPKPALGEVMPEAALRDKVVDYLAKSAALESVWGRPVRAEQLQAEIDRMSETTRDPETLDRLYDALGRDAALIAETLGRQVLVDRLARSSYAGDRAIHEDTRRTAEAALREFVDVADIEQSAAESFERVWKLDPTVGNADPISGDGETETLAAAEWQERISELARYHGLHVPAAERPGESPSPGDLLEAIPLLKPTPLHETPDAFAASMVLERAAGTVRVLTLVWPKRSFDSWWDENRPAFPLEAEAVPPGDYRLSDPETRSCPDDTWQPTAQAVPDGRAYHTAVWTGTEMIVWGGVYRYGLYRSGGRYDPLTDTWKATSLAGAPTARARHAAVWTGKELIVWGGQDQAGLPLSDGGHYEPDTDRWTPTEASGAPSGRVDHTAVWTGKEMIVWGGDGDGCPPAYHWGWPQACVRDDTLRTGARYDPHARQWHATDVGPTTPSGRTLHSAIWTGDEMIVWGGGDAQGSLASGGRYDPQSDRWTPTTPAGVSARVGHAAVWTGSEMFVWGDQAAGALVSGPADLYAPLTDTWRSTGASEPCISPGGVQGRSLGVWTGDEVLVWDRGCGGRYDPQRNTWEDVPSPGTFSDSTLQTLVWTGRTAVLWGGHYPPNADHLNRGWRYHPPSDAWFSMSLGATPTPRYAHSAVWTGKEMIVWGGMSRVLGSWDAVRSGGRYVPATGSWSPTRLDGAPDASQTSSAVWTGREVLVWTGPSGRGVGGRYDPLSDSWAPMDTLEAPAVGPDTPAVWTGDEMVVWGGAVSSDGGRYDPLADSWRGMTVGEDAPSPRQRHTAVWSGTQMVVWGGIGGSGAPVATGGRYDPRTDTWSSTSLSGAPDARHGHVAVWGDGEMVVWGGRTAAGVELSGARYDPGTDTWQAMAIDGAVAADGRHAAAWNGYEMLVWPGDPAVGGARYDPAGDAWVAMSTQLAPFPSVGFHTLVAAGTSLIVWGGANDTTGGVYCADPPTTSPDRARRQRVREPPPRRDHETRKAP